MNSAFCLICNVTCLNERGLSIHIGKMHKELPENFSDFDYDDDSFTVPEEENRQTEKRNLSQISNTSDSINLKKLPSKYTI